MTGDIATMGAYIGAGFATLGMGFAAMGVGAIVGAYLKVALMSKEAKDTANMFVGIAFAEALGIFSFLVALLLMFAV